MQCRLIMLLVLLALVGNTSELALPGMIPTAVGATGRAQSIWGQLIVDAKVLKLPTKFIEQVPPDFVLFEFDDLRTFAAEYHPADHRMVLNRVLSFNAAGGALRPLRQLTNRDLQTLYHELFHAYMDYLATEAPQESSKAESGKLMDFARKQQRCRYERVEINPIPQKQGHTEERFLNDAESWEALNETWAVFVGWAAWTQLELFRSKQSPPHSSPAETNHWIKRLRQADTNAELRGYYEPQDPAEKTMAQKRYLSPAYRISAVEVGVLMTEALGVSRSQAQRSVQAMEESRPESVSAAPCAPTANGL